MKEVGNVLCVIALSVLVEESRKPLGAMVCH